jgi:hypothetical protein
MNNAKLIGLVLAGLATSEFAIFFLLFLKQRRPGLLLAGLFSSATTLALAALFFFEVIKL